MASSLPPSLNLPPHLSAHKYFFVCTLTVAAWDTLVLSPRTWRLAKTPEWPPLKILFHFLRIFMPIEFIVVAVAFFDTNWSQETCQHFFLFEPICTAILLAAASAVHVIRIHAIYDKNRAVLGLMGGLFALQVVVTAIACGFYRSVPLDVGQGCIAGPRHNWVGVYWVAPTLLYAASFILATNLSFKSRATKPIGLWKLMLRDGLNLYGSILIINLVNVLYWFFIRSSGISDTIKTIVTSMAAVLTTSMTLRIVLSVRGTLVAGGTFAGSTVHSHSTSRSGVASRSVVQPQRTGPTFTLDEMRSAGRVGGEQKVGVWDGSAKGDGKVIPIDMQVGKEGREARNGSDDGLGVKVTIDREVDYDSGPFGRGGGR